MTIVFSRIWFLRMSISKSSLNDNNDNGYKWYPRLFFCSFKWHVHKNAVFIYITPALFVWYNLYVDDDDEKRRRDYHYYLDFLFPVFFLEERWCLPCLVSWIVDGREEREKEKKKLVTNDNNQCLFGLSEWCFSVLLVIS